MLDHETRMAILKLYDLGHGIRTIARALEVSRNSVRKVLADGSLEPSAMQRLEKAEPYLEVIRELYAECEGNRVRVCEELAERFNFDIAYSTLTGFCRRHGIGIKPKKRAGRYYFEPGEEIQHDTSPHLPLIDGRRRKLQCASAILCYSRMLFTQLYPTFNRFYAKVFLTDALVYFGGAASRCMVDNTSVIISHGTGKNAVVAPEMEAFAERFAFVIEAHELGDTNRSARVERPFSYIENNFYPGRRFSDLTDLNTQLLSWCDKVNSTYKRRLRAKPIELFVTEAPMLRPLPIHVPEVYMCHERVVDLEGNVNLHTNRYSVPTDMIGRRVEVRETKDMVRISSGRKIVAEHTRVEEGANKWVTLPEHRHSTRLQGRRTFTAPLPEEPVLEAASANLAELVKRLKKRHGARRAKRIRRLHRMYLDYPSDALDKAVATALEYGLLDLVRIERMVLRNVAGDFFRLPVDDNPNDPEGNDYG